MNPSKWTFSNQNVGDSRPLPEDAWSGQWVQSGSLSGSWNRWILEASQSHWRPTGSTENAEGEFQTSAITTYTGGEYEILSTANLVFSASNSESKFALN